jgi:hypothetical protein
MTQLSFLGTSYSSLYSSAISLPCFGKCADGSRASRRDVLGVFLTISVGMWGAHPEFTRINIELTILTNGIEENPTFFGYSMRDPYGKES